MSTDDWGASTELMDSYGLMGTMWLGISERSKIMNLAMDQILSYWFQFQDSKIKYDLSGSTISCKRIEHILDQAGRKNGSRDLLRKMGCGVPVPNALGGNS